MISQQHLLQEMHALYNDHHGWWRSWLRKRLANTSDAADLAHDTYMRVLVSGQAPRPEQSRRYLTRIAKGLAIDFYRRRQIEAAYLETLSRLEPSQVPCEETRALVVEALVELDRLLQGLPPRVRQALLLCKLDGLSYQDIAQQLEVSVSSVEKYIASALRACYEARYDTRT